MGSTERRTALKAASAYFGFSSSESSLPDAADVSVTTVRTRKTDPPKYVQKAVQDAWPENVGAISRTARLSSRDIAHYVNEVREERGKDPIEDPSKIHGWMASLVGDGICMVEIDHRDEEKRLLVNTTISS